MRTIALFFSVLLLTSQAVKAFFRDLYPTNLNPTNPTPQSVEKRSVGGPFPPWPQPLVESHGDYRDEAFLESHIGGPLYEKQHELPKLPIPSLQDTVDRFLPTALPLAESDAEKQSLLAACRKFPEEAKILQERLVQRRDDECQEASWLQDMWTTGYLKGRDPLTHVSYYLFVPDDGKLPDKPTKGIARAAALLVAAAKSRKQICSGQMPYERNGGKEPAPLCSTGFKYLFHSTRIPKPQRDTYHLHDPSLHRHCVVACRGQFYAMDFVDEQGDPLPLSVLEEQLQHCVDLAEKERGYPQLGWLTSADRDFWANARQQLLQNGGTQMQEALTKLESAAFVLNLDDEEPTSLTEAANVFWYGGDSGGCNRWFDKSMQLVCTKDGRVGYVGEHSMLDAAPVIPLITQIMKTTHKRLSNTKQQPSEEVGLADPKDGLKCDNVFGDCWSSPTLVETASSLTSSAKELHEKFVSDHECQVFVFSGYGKKFFKRFDLDCNSYVQQGLQLAAFRLFGKQVGSYEAALTRTFLHGRTETTRPVSPESHAFVECMGLKPNEDCSREEKLALLKEAIASHDEYQRMASQGQGVDRHFFGLSMMLKDENTKPDLFSHCVYDRSKYWQLSTSSVIFTPGFGPTTDDGLGIGYRIDANSCMFTCTSKKKNGIVEPFFKHLDEALAEMGDLMESA